MYKPTQQKRILELLIKAGDMGVNSYDLTYLHHIKQAPTRVKELRLQGHEITSETLKNRSVQYRLIKDKRHEREGIDYVWDFKDNLAYKRYL